MLYRLLKLVLVTLWLVSALPSLAAPLPTAQLAPEFRSGVPKVLVLASYHDGDAWTDRLVHNLRYYFESANPNVIVRIHYLDARDLTVNAPVNAPDRHNDTLRLTTYDRVVLLDDPALALYLQHSSRLPDQHVVAIGINDEGLIMRAHTQGIPLAMTTTAIEESAALARQVTYQAKLMLLHSATPAGRQLKRQALQHLRTAGWEHITAQTWEAAYTTGIDTTGQAVLALDAPLVLAGHTPTSVLTEHFQATLSPLFCYAAYLRAYGCDGGAFVNMASLAHLVAHRLTHRDPAPPVLGVPLELSLSHTLLDRLPQGIDVKVLGAPEPYRLPRWAQLLIGLLILGLLAGAGAAWWRLRRKQQLVDLIAHEAEYDALTQLYSRRKILTLLEQVVARGEPFYLLHVDLDGFRDINDTLGHAQGDRLLQGFAKLLHDTVKRHAAYGRLGGDEFLVLCQQESRALALAQRLIKALDSPFVVEGHHLTLRCSIGIVRFPQHAREATQLLHCADVALYAAKARAEPVALFTEQMRYDQARHTALAQDLEWAIESDDGQLTLYIQPIYSLQQDTIIGGEVLLRWQHPVEGFISPGGFIPIAEASDLILKLNDWVVERTLQHLAADKLHLHIGYLAINISAKQLYARQFACDVLALADHYAIPPRAISFEMTEHVRLMDVASVQQQILELRKAGFGVALDDFGAGYTSISFLQQIQFSCVKIDRSLTAGLCGENAEASRHLMQGLLYLGDRLSQKVIVEGVETQAESELLRSMGVDHVQGFHYYRPMPWSEFARQVRTARSSTKPAGTVHALRHS